MRELAPGLYHSTAPHPSWRPDAPKDHPLDWPRDVGWVACELGERVVFVDPLVPHDLWPQLDELVAGRPVTVLVTLPFHQRTAPAVIARYHADVQPPDGIEPIRVERAAETVFWIPAFAALVPGDCLIRRPGDADLRLPPESWLQFVPGGSTVAQLRDELTGLLAELPIERVLVSHGEPILDGGRAALAAALGE